MDDWFESDPDDVRPRKYRQNSGHPLNDPRWVNDFLSQGVNWVAASGQVTAIATMEPSHALSCLKLLRRTAGDIAVVMFGDTINPPHPATGGIGRVLDPSLLDDITARRMILHSPLARALAGRAFSASAEPQPGWKPQEEQTGPRVTTTYGTPPPFGTAQTESVVPDGVMTVGRIHPGSVD